MKRGEDKARMEWGVECNGRIFMMKKRKKEKKEKEQRSVFPRKKVEVLENVKIAYKGMKEE